MDGSRVIVAVATAGVLLLMSLLTAMKVFMMSHTSNIRDEQEAQIQSIIDVYREHKQLNEENFIPNTCYEPKMFKPMMIIQNKTLGFDYKAATNKLNAERVAMDDGRLLSLIRNYWIQNPSLLQYKFYDNRIDYSTGQSSLVDNLLNNKERGFYVECGAYDGETHSTTLLFERYRKWQGLLIEPDPINFQKLKLKRRMAFIINACVSPYPYPALMRLARRGIYSRLEANVTGSYTFVQCFPLHSILLALDFHAVDFLSLDVGGMEFNILQTMPLKSTNINVISVSCDQCNDKNETDIKKLLKDNRYDLLTKIESYDMLSKDLIFHRK